MLTTASCHSLPLQKLWLPTAQTQLCDLLSKRGFRLRKWLSNSNEVLDQIPEAERFKALQSYSFSENVSERVLGLHWDVEKDIFKFNVNLREFSNTKRGVLSTTARQCEWRKGSQYWV